MVEAQKSALVVIPKQPFDWLNFADPEGDFITLEALREDPNLYLIPECQETEDVKLALEKYATMIFERELDDWITDDTLWPIDRNFEVFCRWFAVSFHSTVLDLSGKK